jgi:DNA-binding MarR family transcriptional regulator
MKPLTRRNESTTRPQPGPTPVPMLTFNELKSLFNVSDGNLSAHARKLEEAGYIACSKSFAGRRPKSEYRLTPVGRKALYRYLEHIEAVIKATRRP